MAQKKMTQREKKYRAELKKQLQAEGTIPPDKPRLNRKKFVEEAQDEWNRRDMEMYAERAYLAWAFGAILAHGRNGRGYSPEAVGAAKVLKIAMRLQQFEKTVRERGDTKYTVGEQYEYIKDILDA